MARVCAGQMHSGTHTERSRFARGTGTVGGTGGVQRHTRADMPRSVGVCQYLDCMSKEPDVYASEVFDGRSRSKAVVATTPIKAPYLAADPAGLAPLPGLPMTGKVRVALC
jgi:hypothetical protein